MTTAAHRVLVVDDEPNIVDVVTMALRYQGFAVESAGTGADALAAVSSFRPDLIVLDIMLPDMEGFDVAQRLARSATGSRSSSSPPATRPMTRSAGLRWAATTT
jgi:two-component system OmpR family response regulator